MGRYLIQAAHTPEAWATLVDHPQDRTKPVQAMVDNVGGQLEAFYFAFGDYDIVSIAKLPTTSRPPPSPSRNVGYEPPNAGPRHPNPHAHRIATTEPAHD